MKKIICLIILAGVLAASWPATAGAASSKKTKAKASAAKPETAKPAKTEAAKPAEKAAAPAPPAATGAAKANPAAGEKKADPPAGGEAATPGLGFGSDFPFDLMRADSIEIDPEGLTVLTARVRIESKEFNISCDQLKMDNKTKMVYATGNPVNLEQGKTVLAKCRNLVYNLNNKSATLENEASILQDQGNGQKMQATADTIKIDNDGKPGSQPKISFIMKPGSSKPPEIRQIGTAKPVDAKSKSGNATKVNEGNMNLLNMPMPKSPGVE